MLLSRQAFLRAEFNPPTEILFYFILILKFCYFAHAFVAKISNARNSNSPIYQVILHVVSPFKLPAFSTMLPSLPKKLAQVFFFLPPSLSYILVKLEKKFHVGVRFTPHACHRCYVGFSTKHTLVLKGSQFVI